MRYYEKEAAGLGAEFLSAVNHALSHLELNPSLGTPLKRGARKLLVRRFPFTIIYRVETERVLVLAVGHHRRHPDFWLNRA